MKERVGIMKMEENEKKKKKIVKKAKKVRGIVMMTLLCVLMMSAATYAWFTLSKTAKIANLTMTVGEATGLQIAKNVGTSESPSVGTYGGVLTFGDSEDGHPYKITGKLLPATTVDGKNFLKPVYNDDGEVSGTVAADSKLDNSTALADSEGYYYETTFYLKALGSQNVNVVLKAGASLPSSGIVSESDAPTGTYVLGKSGETKDGDYHGFQAVRISLTAQSQTLIYEPNFNVHGTDGTAATQIATITPVTATSKQNANGTWDGGQTQTLTLSAGADTLVTMRIWIEGTDTDCVNEISLDNIIAQLQFEEVTSQP